MNRIEIARFTAKTDKGKIYTIIEYQDVLDSKGFDMPYDKKLGLSYYLTSTGLIVSKIDSETFHIVSTNEFVRKVN